jgi:site-specific recombinase XerD
MDEARGGEGFSYRLRLVQRLLGHSKVSTTAIYADVLDEDVAAAQDVAWPGR